MSLLLTSCTMGKQPDRLLNKGPQYLRTRTNSGLFAQKKTSAVELLAASKAQFYTVKRSVDLDKQQDLAGSDGHAERYHQSNRKRGPVRSKSEYDLSQLHLAITDEESDENNNGINTVSVNTSKDVPVKDSDFLTAQNSSTVNPEEEERELLSEDALVEIQTHISSVHTTPKPGTTQQSELAVLLSTTSATYDQAQKSHEHKYVTLIDETERPPIKKPVPLPRKLKEKPVPPARKPTAKSDSEQCLSPIDVPRPSSALHNPSLHNPSLHNPSLPNPSLPNPSLPNKNSLEDDPKLKALLIDANFDATRTQACANSSSNRLLPPSVKPPLPQKPLLFQKEIKHSECGTQSESSTHIYTATAIFISKPDNVNQRLMSRSISITNKDTPNNIVSAESKSLEGSLLKDVEESLTIPKKNSDVCASSSVRAGERERKPIDSAGLIPDCVEPVCVSRSETVEKSTFFSTSTLEMSIESVDQAVYESEISAIPTASVEATIMQEADPEIREITRSNSSLSGKIEQQNTSPLSASPTPHYSSVPRSYSDISCHLEGQHSRESSNVSSHSRLSRASVGTDLENFFNQMGLEKGILEPLNRLKELQTSEVFDSMSSLDSHDAASICSTYSCSDQEWSDSQSTDRSQQQTSIVERNARIIKWLCNVRKAKTHKSDSAAASNA